MRVLHPWAMLKALERATALRCKVRQGIFGRWFIFHADNDHLGWTGSTWADCDCDGAPHQFQISNFETQAEAIEEALAAGLVVLTDAAA